MNVVSKQLLLVWIGLVFSTVVCSSPCQKLEGNSIQGGLLWGHVERGTEIRFAGRSVPVLPSGDFLLGIGRDMPASVQLEKAGKTTCQQIVLIKQREYRLQNISGVPQRTVTPSAEHQARIQKERRKVRDAKARRISSREGIIAVRTGFQWPVTGRISGVYGSQRIYNGSPGTPHYGVDVARPKGTAVKAPAHGEVTLAEPDLFYSGGTVILDHGYGLSSSFLHLSEIKVSVGDVLKPGDSIGAIGSTGRATGPHLDWRMSWFDQRIDPQLLVPPMPN